MDVDGDALLFCAIGLYVMYTYMMKQRRKVFGGQRTAKPKSS